MQPLRLKWSHTWFGGSRDFTCRTETGDPVGRIFFVGGGLTAQWLWLCTGSYRGRDLSYVGHASDDVSASHEVERAWFKALAKIDAQLGPL
jgi:hypothetical protein